MKNELKFRERETYFPPGSMEPRFDPIRKSDDTRLQTYLLLKVVADSGFKGWMMNAKGCRKTDSNKTSWITL